MTDPRYTKLAALLVRYSTELKKGDRVLLDMIDVPGRVLHRTDARGARGRRHPADRVIRHTRVNREMLRQTNSAHARLVRDLELFRMKKMQAYIAIRGSDNANENADVPSDLMALYSKTTPARAQLPRQQDPLVRAALAHAQHGPGRQHEHRGLREPLF